MSTLGEEACLAGRDKVFLMDRVVKVLRSFEEADEADDQFYAELAPQERLEMLLELIDRHRSELGETASRLARVYRITELSSR